VATVGESQIPQTRRTGALVTFAVASLSLAVGFFIARFLFMVPGPPKPLRFTPLVVDSTLKLFPAWSPNGKTLAYAGEVKGKLQIFTRTLGATKPTQIAHQDNDCFRPFWAPGGERIYYRAYRGNDPIFPSSKPDLWSIGAAGGTPELVGKGVAGAAISPDG